MSARWYKVFAYGPGNACRADYAQMTPDQVQRAQRIADSMGAWPYWDLRPASEGEVIIEYQLLQRADVLSDIHLEALLLSWEQRYP